MKRFSKPVLSALDATKYLGIRAGLDEHRFIAVWPIVINGRLFIRSWNDKPTGWYRAFLDEPRGAIQLPGGREIAVRARPIRAQRVIEAMEDAYAKKYNTPGSRKYVVGFKWPRRRAATVELMQLNMASRPRLLKADIEMQRWSAALGDEISTWPKVTSRPMFGMLGFYRGKNIFAALPRTRAMNTPFSLMVKLPPTKHPRLQAGRGPGAGWMTFEMTSEADLGEALRWLERAYEKAQTQVT